MMAVMLHNRGMKRLLALLLILLHQQAYLQNQARLYSDAGLFHVFVNDIPVNRAQQAEVVIKNVLKDTLEVKIAFGNGEAGRFSLYLVEKGKHTTGKEFSFLVMHTNGRTGIRFMDMRELVNPPIHLLPRKPSADTGSKYRDAVLSRFGTVKEGRPVLYNNMPENAKCDQPMPAEYMNYSRILLSQAESQDRKFQLASEISRNNCLSLSQLRELISHIEYEVEKLKLIRIAYFSLTEPKEAKELESAFRFESSRKQFREFLANSESHRIRMAAACDVASDIKEIQSFGAQLAAFATDAQRMELFRKGYGDHCYSVEHAKQLLSIFIHDREKLEAAKLMYFRSSDKPRFIEAGETFSYKESVAELEDFLDKQKPAR
jgi:hypothetical protein